MARFFDDALRWGAVPGSPELLVLDYASDRIPLPRVELAHPRDIPAALASRSHFDVIAAGHGDPQRRVVQVGEVSSPAVPFDEPYHVEIRCCVRPTVVSTSDLHEETEAGVVVPFFDEPAPDVDSPGLYSNPRTLELITVPHAGCARFWVGIEFGTWLFPSIEDTLDLVEPDFLGLMEDLFGVRFRQGCQWG